MARKRRRKRENPQIRRLDERIKRLQQATYTAEEAIKRWDAMHEAQRSRVSVIDAYRVSVWAYGAITIIADQVSGHPFVIERDGEPVESAPITRLVNRPNDYDHQNTSRKFRSVYLTELLLNGAVLRAFTEIDGVEPRRMAAFPRHRFRARTMLDDNGVERPARWERTGRGSRATYIAGDDIHHDSLYNPYHDWEGMAPLTAAIIQLNNDVNLSELLNRYFVNDGSTGLIMSSKEPVTQDQANEAAEAWAEQNAGIAHAYLTKFIGYGFTPHVLGASFDPKMQQLLGSLTKEAIVTGVFKIPPTVFGSQGPSTGVQIGDRTTEPEKETFLVNVIMAWAKRYDEDFNRDVAWRFGGQYAGRTDFSSNPILERRRLERAKAAVELIDRGVHLNEVIDWLKLEIGHMPEGDDYWVQNTMVPARIILDAGQDVLQRQLGGQQSAAVADYVNSIVAAAGRPGVRDAARSDPRRIADSAGKTNGQRVKEVMS